MLEQQLIPGTFAHAVHILIDELHLSAFDAHYGKDRTRASAYAPSVLLTVVLVAYARDIVSSRAIERERRSNVLFIALTEDAQPSFTATAVFISRSRDAITTSLTA